MLRLPQQSLDLGAGRGADDAAEARAFERGCGGRETKRRRLSAALGERERKGGVKDVAGGKRVDAETANAFCRRTALPSCQSTPAAPSVAAMKPRQKLDGRST